MTTQYTTILKLALPVQGELSGTWGDVVNDNITQMVEQAIAGKATINSWTANAHTLTTADGTTSESRCAILELTDTGTALTGAGTVTCPTNTKLYIVDNNTAEIITIKTAAGTGVAVPVGKTMLVYCDGTNVVEGVTHANSLSLGTSTSTVNAIDTATDLGAGSSSNSNLPTQLAVKTYVDGQIAATNELSEVLAAGNVTGANDIDVENAQKVQFRDAAIYLNSSVDGQLDIVADGEVQIDTALVDINGNLDVSGTTNISGSTTFTKNAIAGVAISTVARASNTVTVTNAAVHGLTSGDLVNINGVANRSFNGYFTVSVSSTTVFTYSQTGADESSTGGTSTEVVYNLNASGTALNQMNGPLNIAANSAIDGLEITQSGSGEALSITGGNALFGDNDKAIFGAGSDLQIYHDASDSIINDNGTGSLKLQQGGSTKLEVTATGIDVTGTVTADGLTVDTTNATPNTFSDNVGPVIDLKDTAGATDEKIVRLFAAAQNLFISNRNDDLSNKGNRVQIANNGDISFYEDTGTTAKLFWDASAESLGIGTSSPGSAFGFGKSLEIKDSTSCSLQINSNDTDRMELGVSASGGFIGTPTGSTPIRFTTNGNEAMRIDSSGDVSLADDNELFFNASSSSQETRLGWKYGGTLQSWIEREHSDGSLVFGNQGAERMRIDSSGNVGIGTDSPQKTLDVKGTFAISNSTTSYWDFDRDDSDGSLKIADTGSERLRIDSAGNLLVGTSSATGAGASSGLILSHFDGSLKNGLYLSDTRTAAGTDVAIIFGRGATITGSITTTLTTTAYVTSSDQRLKENIADADDAGSKIDAIQVRKFDWKADGSHQDYGMVAQELQSVAPEAVSAPADPDEMMGVDYSKLVPMMLKEIQSLRARVAQLENN